MASMTPPLSSILYAIWPLAYFSKRLESHYLAVEAYGDVLHRNILL